MLLKVVIELLYLKKTYARHSRPCGLDDMMVARDYRNHMQKTGLGFRHVMNACLFVCLLCEGAAIRNSFLSFKGLLRTLKVVVCVMASTYLGRETISVFVCGWDPGKTGKFTYLASSQAVGRKQPGPGKNKGREVKG